MYDSEPDLTDDKDNSPGPAFFVSKVRSLKLPNEEIEIKELKNKIT